VIGGCVWVFLGGGVLEVLGRECGDETRRDEQREKIGKWNNRWKTGLEWMAGGEILEIRRGIVYD
jgi:hypothetical protein